LLKEDIHLRNLVLSSISIDIEIKEFLFELEGKINTYLNSCKLTIINYIKFIVIIV